MSTIFLSIVAIALTVTVKSFVGIGFLKLSALFCGLEGTVLLASSISPPHGDMEEMPKGFLKKLHWSFTEGARMNYPFRYNAVYFYSGLILLALSFVLSALDTPGT